MIGTDLNLSLPALSDTLATIVSKTATALQAIEDSIADKATPAALNIISPLALNGNSLTQVTSVQLSAGNIPSAAGSVFYNAGEFYLIDSVGIIQLTSSGAINASGIGAIVGDYGGVNPARVTYDDASGEYRFTEDTGVWADLVADDLVLEGSAGSVRFAVDSAITSARTFSIKSLPSSGKSLLVYNAATSTLEDAAVSSPTNAIGTITIGSDIKWTGTQQIPIPLNPATSGVNVTVANLGVVATNSNWSYASAVIPMRVGDRVKSVQITSAAGCAATLNLALKRQDATAGTSATIDSWSGTLGAGLTLTHVIAGPVAVDTFQRWYVTVASPSGIINDSFTDITVTYDHP